MSSLLEDISRSVDPALMPELPEWVASLRAEGRDQFASHGLPHRRLEAWKYTPLDRLAGAAAQAVATDDSAANAEPYAALRIEGSHKLSFVDGALRGTAEGLPAGVQVTALADALRSDDGTLRRELEKIETQHPSQVMVSINNAALANGVVVRVAAGVDAGCLSARWTSSEAPGAALSNSRVILMLEAGARLDWVEDVQLESSLNVITQVVLGEGSRLQHARLQDNGERTWYISRTEVEQADNSHFEQASLDLGAGLARHDLRVALAGSGAACNLLGAYLPDGTAHVDHHLDVRHEAPGCHSEQTFRGVLYGQSRAIFNGRVHVLPGADESEAHQSNANLLLSRQAEVNTKPELVIEADEVIASHGATVGQLDESAVFYLRSRGIDQPMARQLLTGAFCRFVVESMSVASARGEFSDRLEQHLGGRL